jgi:thioredoxin reductase/bacterioferritin-associated ferredoxin
VSDCDLLIVGAGPAGMSAAIAARECGLRVIVIDDQAAPGGQIYRNIEESHRLGLAASIGADYAGGIALVRRFRECGATYLPHSSVWQVNPDGGVYFSCGGGSRKLQAQYVLFATGSMERPAVAPGWTLPGVMTVGAAQILQKTAHALPGRKVWIAGCGPLAVYYAAGLAAQGHRIAGFLDTAVPGNRLPAARHWRGGLQGIGYLLKGLGYLARIEWSSMRRVGSVTALEIVGDDRVRGIRWQAGGAWHEEEADGVLLHEGVVPHTQLAVATGCAHAWDEVQWCFRPVASNLGQTSLDRVLVAGDCSGIGGARAAALQGRIGGAEVARRIDSKQSERCVSLIARTGIELRRELAVRPLLDRLYAPREAVRRPLDTDIVCRCESVTAGHVRNAVRSGCRTVDGVKSQLRCGMGPCQGRVCGLPVAGLVAHERGVSPDEVGPYRIRPPVKPITLRDLAALADAK